MGYYFIQFAAAYGQGAYGAGTYACPANQTACDVAASQPNTLVNTGIALLAIVVLACIIIFIAILARNARRKANLQKEAAAEGQVPPESNPR